MPDDVPRPAGEEGAAGSRDEHVDINTNLEATDEATDGQEAGQASTDGPADDRTRMLSTLDKIGGTMPATSRLGDVAAGRGGESLPSRLGRYRILRLLGQGGFGIVYLARDRELGRDVAIKVPTARSLATPGRLETLLVEARGAARLKHEGIVRVFDVGRSDDGLDFIVLEYVEGKTLQDELQEGRIDPVRLAELAYGIADAIHHAHKAGMVHRDLKPSNIIIEERGAPRVADFGLAITDAVRPGKAGEVAGTPTHMAPEQVRGEAHRLDGRTDIWALGVILYQGLAHRLPFSGDDREALFDEILHRDPKPPRQIDDSTPRELERICLKCLSKRMTDRYGTALDLAEDLRAWLLAARFTGNLPPGTTPDPDAGFRPATTRIVPKGLRAFEREDADFFLDLLPGPRDRHGLPESVRFWKSRIEDRDPESTFGVGLLCGPSGCGKSSLVRAGLLPRLGGGIAAVCVDASPDDTGPRILKALRKRLPGLPPGIGLAETFARLREEDGTRVVVLLDQFEQWLHAHGGSMRSEVVDALRQCDGAHLQAIVMVRDDFAMAAARLMDALDIPIVQGQNFATLDLFDVDHARRVLERFGQAFGRLPSGPPGPSAEQGRFLDAVASGLATGGLVVPVRLALFAEMIKGKSWIPSTLAESGGTEGIGVRFLEETFNGRAANPRLRAYGRAARDVLKALLPGVGSDIKGRTRSYAELKEASGLGDRPGKFDDLLRVLDGELRLITPIDPSGSAPAPDSAPGGKRWQLTHDYLVPSLREWLTRGQKATRRGRAELTLEDRAELWDARPESRHLPSLSEWIAIRAFTDRSRWTTHQHEMMTRAGKMHGLRMAVFGLLVAASFAGTLALRDRFEESRLKVEADGLIDTMLAADVAELPKIAADLDQCPIPTGPRLESEALKANATRKVRFRANYALAGRPGEAATRLIEMAPSADTRELTAIRDRVAPYATSLQNQLWALAESDETSPGSMLRIGALLAVADREGEVWDEIAPTIANALLSETLELDAWVDLFRPVATALTPFVLRRFFDTTATSVDRVKSALVMAHFADSPLFSDILLRADGQQFSMLIPGASRHREMVVEAARRALAPSSLDTPERRARARNAAIALLRLGLADEIEPYLGIAEDPTLRTMLIRDMKDFGVQPDLLLDLLASWQEPIARQALLLALASYRGRDLPAATNRDLMTLLARSIREGSHQSERSAAEWLLRSMGREAEFQRWSRDLAPASRPEFRDLRGRDWWISPQGHTLTIVGGPQGSGMDSAARPGRRVAIGIHEVTLDQFRRFQAVAAQAGNQDDGRLPATKVSIVDAMRFCRWLSDEEKIPEDQMCYPPIDQIREGDVHLTEERRSRIGYRLPTEDEWECAARAGSKTLWFCGDDEEHFRQFAWSVTNSGEHLHRVGMLRPNQFGFFDILGNTGEWCHPDPPGQGLSSRFVVRESYLISLVLKAGTLGFAIQPNPDYNFLDLLEIQSSPPLFVLRGGRYNASPSKTDISTFNLNTNRGYSFTGFRVARTIAAGP